MDGSKSSATHQIQHDQCYFQIWRMLHALTNVQYFNVGRRAALKKSAANEVRALILGVHVRRYLVRTTFELPLLCLLFRLFSLWLKQTSCCKKSWVFSATKDLLSIPTSCAK